MLVTVHTYSSVNLAVWVTALARHAYAATRTPVHSTSFLVAAHSWLCRRRPLPLCGWGGTAGAAAQAARGGGGGAQREEILASGRPLEPQMRTEPRTEVNARIDPYKIRPGAMKMVLPPEEEAKLALVRAQGTSA